ncbi:hypothetical protein HBH49_120740 [Parastagonospora nodorum]|nr:hypothetical protein HBH49_120740 [Parastagonospora nodorum]
MHPNWHSAGYRKAVTSHGLLRMSTTMATLLSLSTELELDVIEHLDTPFNNSFFSISRDLLSLSQLPNLEHVIVQFGWTKYPSTDEGMHRDEYNSTEELQGQGTDVEFRSLMLQSYEALARNPPSYIKSLEPRNVLAHTCSAWNTAEFQESLKELSSFSISLQGGDNGAGGSINTTPGYFEFIPELDFYFFEHLKNITHFSSATTDDGPPAIQEDTRISALRLCETHMPQLRRLELESVFISQSLSAFIPAHGDTLESL